MKTCDPNQNQADAGAQFPDADGFFYSGPSPKVWAGYLKNRLLQALAPLPQERDIAMVARWAAWPEGDRQRDGRLDRAWARVGELIRAIREDGEELTKAGIAPGEEELFWKAASMANAKRIQERGEGIRDLSFLEGMTQLKELDLWDNDIEDLSPMAGLTGLRELSIPFNLISDLSPLAGLDKLVQLKVYGNHIASLEPLRGLTSLNVLDLRGNPLEPGALACLRKCKRLGMLDLSNTGLGDISGLEFCRTHILELQDNPGLTGLEVISTMKRLCCLYLDTETARRYDIQALAPQLIECGELDGLSVYVWPEKYYN